MTNESVDISCSGGRFGPFNVFLSHNSKDKLTVRSLASALIARGLSVWLDENELRPGLPWQELLEEGIRSSESVAVLIGKDGIGPWEDVEMRAALILATNSNLPVIPVILPDVSHVPSLPLFLQNRTWVDLRPCFSEIGLGKLEWGITGRRLGSGERKVGAEKLNVTGRLQPQLFDGAKTAAPLGQTGSTTRYLRRRARVITRGTQQFKLIMNALTSRQHKRDNRVEAVETFEGFWETLKDPYEQVMTHAAFLESFGQIELMLSVLERARFRGTAESARVLYEAIAREKLDDLDGAKRLLRSILDTETQKDLVRAAQFNIHVCYEKAADFANVNFEAFFRDQRNAFVDRERLCDKAVAMHMIVCMEQDRPFVYKRLLTESLEYLRENSVAGYAKTLLTKVESEKSMLSESTANAVLEDLSMMDANSRIAILIRVCDYLPPEAELLRQSLLDRVRQEPEKSGTVVKWKRSLQRMMRGDDSA